MPGALHLTGRLFLIDGYALIYRAFFAMLSRPLTTSRGENTSVAWGIANFLLRLREVHRPDFVAWVHDSGTTFRTQRLPEYKATRTKLTAELQQDFDDSIRRVEELLAAFRIPLVTVDGWEADDVIATLATRAADLGLEVVIVSGDKDFYQLISERISLLNPGRGGPAAVDEQVVTVSNAAERLGVPPHRTVDFLALVGDSADNVPGVSGIGEKTAQKLLAEFGDLETLLARAGEVSARRAREALLSEAGNARLSRELITLRRDAPVDLDLTAMALKEPDWSRLLDLCRRLEFTTLARSVAQKLEGTTAAPAAGRIESPVPPSPGGALADSVDAVSDAVRHIRAADVVAVCVAAVGEPVRSRLVGLAAAAGGRAWYFPFAHRPPGEMFAESSVTNLPPATDSAMRELAALIEDPSVPKVGHDLKHARLVLKRAGLELRGLAFDTMLASYVLDPGRRSHALESVALEHLGVHPREDDASHSSATLAELAPAEAATAYGARALWSLALRERIEPLLRIQALERVFREIEMPLIEVLAGMEWDGIAIDPAVFERLAADFRQELARLERDIFAAAGTDFNLLSTPQLRHVLFEKLQLPVLKKTKTGASTDADVLEELAAMGHEVPRLLIQYREVSKLLSTYVEALPRSVNPDTGRIHTSFTQIGAATGRLSSAEPNLQNIPVRTSRGAEIRRGFIPRPGWKFVVGDYSQIELRLLAHLSGDPAFVAAFRAGGDIHRQTAALIFDTDPASVTPDQRARAKTINFATIYGQGPHSLSRQLGISRDEAKRFIDAYFERFAGVRAFLDDCIARARERGYAETIFGRRRYIPEIRDKNFNVRAFGERTATNSPIQGSAADLIKIAMVNLAGALERRGSARLILQVHDELIVESPAEEAPEVARLLKQLMEGVATLDVPLVADVGIGDTWLDAKA